VKFTLQTDEAETLYTASSEWDFENPPADATAVEDELARLMEEHGGVGFAANQMGFLYRVFAMKIDNEICFFYNPKVLYSIGDPVVVEEGCLSFPGLFFKVKRPAYVQVRYQTSDGQVVEGLLNGMAARCFQHELDHLDGVCFTSRVSKLTLDMAKKKRDKRERKK
jgi:peptide deformylase